MRDAFICQPPHVPWVELHASARIYSTSIDIPQRPRREKERGIANMASQLPNPYGAGAQGLPNPYAAATVAESAPVKFSEEQAKAEQKKTPGIYLENTLCT